MVAKRKRWSKFTKQLNDENVEKGLILNYPDMIARRYERRIDQLIAKMLKETEAELNKLNKTPEAKEQFAGDASIASQSRILMNRLISKYRKLFGQNAKTIVDDMVLRNNEASKSNIIQSFQKIAPSVTLNVDNIGKSGKEALNASIDYNVDLIKSIPEQYLTGVKDAVNRSITNADSGGLAELTEYLHKAQGKTKRRAHLIATDQTRKVYNSLNASRMKKIGQDKFEWIHTGGSTEPRPFHIQAYPDGLNGGVFSLTDPPIIDPKTGERGLPGQLYNCSCRMRPVISFDEGS